MPTHTHIVIPVHTHAHIQRTHARVAKKVVCSVIFIRICYFVTRVEPESEFFDGEKDHDKDDSVLDV